MNPKLPDFELLESLRWEPEQGYFLLSEHLQRLEKSAQYFNFTFSLFKVNDALESFAKTLELIPQKVRLKLSLEGKINLNAQPLNSGLFQEGARVGIATLPIDHQNIFLYHKTTERTAYQIALASQPCCQDVILWNEAGMVTESTIANLIIPTEKGLITPPMNCGLLGGTLRGKLLAKGKIQEQMISLTTLRHKPKIYLINSVRGWIQLNKKEDEPEIWTVIFHDDLVALI